MLIQIKISEDNLKTQVQIGSFKKKLEVANKEIDEFKEFLTQSKINKLQILT